MHRIGNSSGLPLGEVDRRQNNCQTTDQHFGKMDASVGEDLL
jgi:hypothetical protein